MQPSVRPSLARSPNASPASPASPSGSPDTDAKNTDTDANADGDSTANPVRPAPPAAAPPFGRKKDSMLTRGLALLKAFGPDDVELSLSVLAARAGLPKPTTHRLVAELLDSGFLERGERGILLGRQMFVLGDRLPRDQKIRALALPHLQRLRGATGATTVFLSAVRDREVVHLLRVGAADGAGELAVSFGARRVLTGPTGPVLRLEDTSRGCAILTSPVGLPGRGMLAAASAVCASGQETRRVVAPGLRRMAQELAVCLAALPEFRTVPGAA